MQGQLFAPGGLGGAEQQASRRGRGEELDGSAERGEREEGIRGGCSEGARSRVWGAWHAVAAHNGEPGAGCAASGCAFLQW